MPSNLERRVRLLGELTAGDRFRVFGPWGPNIGLFVVVSQGEIRADYQTLCTRIEGSGAFMAKSNAQLVGITDVVLSPNLKVVLYA